MEIPKIGEFKRRVRLESIVETPSGDSGVSRETLLVAGAWAKIEPVGGAVYQSGQQTDEAITHRIWLRGWFPGIGLQHEISDGSVRYRLKRSSNLNGAFRATMIEAEELSGASSL
jgi:head-tail adaptor